MTDAAGWRTDTSAGDYFLHQKKQLSVADRRPVIRRASDIVGPGIAGTAVRLTDFNDVLATFNGFYSAAEGAVNAPIADQPLLGWVSSDAELGGVQLFTGLTNNITYRRTFKRNPADSTVLYWSSWMVVGAA